LVNEITTGGATPLHMAGMSRRGERATSLLIERGGDINAIDTYGFKPIHRMASNNLAIGIEALLSAGADPSSKTSHGETPWQRARSSRASDVMLVLTRYLK
jgi:ankyrin repeat protein